MFEEHKVEWTPEKVATFWNYITKNDSMSDTYFCQQVGDDIIRTVKKHIPLQGNVLDYGCGNGDLLEKLAKKKITCAGADYSSESVLHVNKRMEALADRQYFQGAVTMESIPSPNLKSESYDIVFLIETIEHMFDEDLNTVLSEIKRVLKKGGYIVATSPNDEDLGSSSIICPDCGCVFHTYQHMISWNKEKLVRFMEDSIGYKTKFCNPVLFYRNTFLSPFVNMVYKLEHRKFPRLMYIGQKV